MADEEKRQEDAFESLEAQYQRLQSQLSMMEDLSYEEIASLEDFYYLWLCWGDFHVYILNPELPEHLPAKMLYPSYNHHIQAHEYVYTIADYGGRLSTSPGDLLPEGSRCTGRLLNTVEKMMALAIKRSKRGGGNEGETLEPEEIQVAFLGVDVAQRRAYELCLNAKENVVVTNFDPGEWGQRFFKRAQHLYERGFLPGILKYKT